MVWFWGTVWWICTYIIPKSLSWCDSSRFHLLKCMYEHWFTWVFENNKITAIGLKLIAGRWFKFLKVICIKAHIKKEKKDLIAISNFCMWLLIEILVYIFLKTPPPTSREIALQPSSVRYWWAWAECSLLNWFKQTAHRFAVPFLWYLVEVLLFN